MKTSLQKPFTIIETAFSGSSPRCWHRYSWSSLTLEVVASGVNAMRSESRSFLLVTHYQRLLDYIEPDFVHVLADGRIIRSGDKSLALELEAKGYSWLDDDEVA